MGIEIIKPFIKSITVAFETLAKHSPEYTDSKQVNLDVFSNEHDYYKDIAAVIALPGSKIGSLVVAFEKQTAVNIASSFMNENITEIDDMVKDVIGELANTVAGNITEDLSEMHFQRALPNIYFGSEKELNFPPGFVCYSSDFKSEFGPFNLRVSILEDENI